MKHGDKKGNSVKAATHASAKEKRAQTGGKKSAASKAGSKADSVKAKAGPKTGSKTSGKAGPKAGGEKQSPGKAADAPAQSRASSKRAVPEDAAFANPSVAAAFKRSLKKYGNAYRRLTD